MEKAIMASRARSAARKARDLTRRKSALEVSSCLGSWRTVPAKTRKKRKSTWWKGDSAGGSAKQGRDRNFQAILPLRGKILNVEKARLDKMLNSQEIRAMITAFGCGIGMNSTFPKPGTKIIIMTDADVDGAISGPCCSLSSTGT